MRLLISICSVSALLLAPPALESPSLDSPAMGDRSAVKMLEPSPLTAIRSVRSLAPMPKSKTWTLGPASALTVS